MLGIHSLLLHESCITDWLVTVFQEIFTAKVWSKNFLTYCLRGILVLH